MTAIHVATQDELDAALTNPAHTYSTHEIVIDTPAGVWITIGSDHGKDIRAWGSATVRAWGSATVLASGLSVVTRRLSTSATVTGGTILDLTTLDLTSIDNWAAYHGATVEDGIVTLYKCLPQDLTSGSDYGRHTVWPTSGDIECDDFEATDERGHGLHLSPTPEHAWAYLSDESRPRFLEVTAPLDDIVPITGGTAKCKVRSCTVVREVDVMGRPVTSEAAKS